MTVFHISYKNIYQIVENIHHNCAVTQLTACKAATVSWSHLHVLLD